MSKELKDKNIKDLEKMVKEAREELRKFRFSMTGSKTRNTKEGQNLRKKIARILTEISIKEKSEK